jgi:integrase
MRLTDRQVRNAKPKDKPYRLGDGYGLHLLVSTAGTKSWQLRYFHAGKEQVATLGRYPEMQLTVAREAARTARGAAATGEQLTAVKRALKATKAASAAATFEVVAKDWVADEARRQRWSADHRKKVEASIDRHLLDVALRGVQGLRGIPVASITAATCAPVLAAAEKRAPVLASKIRQRLRGVLDFAVERGLIAVNPLPMTRRGAKGERKHLPAVVDAKEIGEILRAADAAQTRCSGIHRAHLICAFTAQRVQTVVGARWKDIDLTSAEWVIRRESMKVKASARGDHVIPISPWLLREMIEWKRADNGGEWVCLNESGKAPVTREGVEVFYRRKLELNGKHSPHSWRTVFKTWSLEKGENNAAIRAQMDHAKGSMTEAAYDAAPLMEQRRELMKRHEERLLAARDGGQVLSFRRQA